MFEKVATCVLLLLISWSVDAQSPSWGGCPDVTTQSNFDLKKYLGTWYEISKFNNFFQSGKCGSAEYSLKENGRVKVDNREYVDGKLNQALGEAYQPDANEPAKLKVRFSQFSPWGDYWVIDTDYKNYTLVYSCKSILGIGKFTFSWILSRERTLDQAVENRLKNKLQAFGVDVSPFNESDQGNC